MYTKSTSQQNPCTRQLLRGRCGYDETLSNGLSTAECCKISTEV